MCRLLRVVIYLTLHCVVLADRFPEGREFRSDYKYNRKTDAYYKLHEGSGSWVDSSEICKAEGGRLMPDTQDDVTFAHSMFKMKPYLNDAVWIDKDIDDNDEADYEGILGLAAHEEIEVGYRHCPSMNRLGDLEMTTCSSLLSFLCRIDKKDIDYNSQCDVSGKDYDYNNVTGSCYKFSKQALIWNEAKSECEHEGSHLLVVNSELEHREIKEFMDSKPITTPRSFHTYYVIIGFRVSGNERMQRIFRTIYNDTLDAAGYNEWSEGEPNNFASSEYCGSLYRLDGKLNDVNCVNPYAFICEKEVGKVK